MTRNFFLYLFSLLLPAVMTSCDKEEGFRPSWIAEGADFDSPDHYFYVTFGTMPTLYAGLHMLSHDKPSYVFYERTATFDAGKLPSHVTVCPYMGANDQQPQMREWMKNKIREIDRENPQAIFGLYVDDLRCRLGYDWFVAQGIDSSRVKVTMLSDGTGTYNNFYNYFNVPGTGEQNWKTYASQVEALDWSYPRGYATRSIGEFESWEWPYYLSTRPGYRLLLQDASLFETQDPYVQEQMPAMYLWSRTPYEMLADLTEEERKKFFEMASFDRDAFDAGFDASSKKNLVIIGTNGDGDNQRAYVQRLYDEYKDRYDLFFKPHPSDVTSADYETAFPGLTLLPGQMPFEIFVWSLIDKIDMIGGYPSTVYLTVPVEKVTFLFASGPDALIRPLNLIFAAAQDRVEWMQPE